MDGWRGSVTEDDLRSLGLTDDDPLVGFSDAEIKAAMVRVTARLGRFVVGPNGQEGRAVRDLGECLDALLEELCRAVH